MTGMLNTSGQAVAGWRHEQMTAVGSLKDKFHWNADLAAVTCQLSPRYGKLWHRLGVASPCEGEDGYDSRHGRFINRDPIGERGGINLYAFLANNPLGGYEYLGMGFLSKLFKGIVNFVKKVVIRAVLTVIPVVGPFLAAAYTAYMWGKSVYDGYKAGGVLGAIGGFVSGPGIGGSGSWKDVLKAAFWESATREATASLVRAVDRKVRGFAKWFGRLSTVASVRSGWTPAVESFRELGRELRASLGGSPQQAKAAAPSAAPRGSPQLDGSVVFDADGGGTVTVGPLKWWTGAGGPDGAGRSFDRDAYRAALRKLNQTVREIAWPGSEAGRIYAGIAQAERTKAQQAARMAEEDRVRDNNARDSARAYLRSGGHMQDPTNLYIVGGATLAPAAIAYGSPYLLAGGQVGGRLLMQGAKKAGDWATRKTLENLIYAEQATEAAFSFFGGDGSTSPMTPGSAAGSFARFGWEKTFGEAPEETLFGY